MRHQKGSVLSQRASNWTDMTQRLFSYSQPVVVFDIFVTLGMLARKAILKAPLWINCEQSQVHFSVFCGIGTTSHQTHTHTHKWQHRFGSKCCLQLVASLSDSKYLCPCQHLKEPPPWVKETPSVTFTQEMCQNSYDFWVQMPSAMKSALGVGEWWRQKFKETYDQISIHKLVSKNWTPRWTWSHESEAKLFHNKTEKKT